MQDLYDEEFDEALYELMIGARGIHEEHLTSSGGDDDRVLRQHFRQLVSEAEATVSAFEREFGSRDLGSLSETEVDGFAERYAPSSALDPEFEEFLDKWKKKLSNVVKKAAGFVKKGIKFATKIGLGPVLNKIKALVKPMLEKVLQLAIGRLPEAVVAAAQQLAARIFGTAAPESDATSDPAAPTDSAPAADAGAVQAPVQPDVTEVQQDWISNSRISSWPRMKWRWSSKSRAHGTTSARRPCRSTPISIRPASVSSTSCRTSARAKIPRRTFKTFSPPSSLQCDWEFVSSDDRKSSGSWPTCWRR